MYDMGFCLDVSHALKAGGWGLFLDLLELKPAHFHITDGDIKEVVEKHHMPLGKGNYPLRSIRDVIPLTARITIEPNRRPSDSLDIVIDDLKYWREICEL
jgi:sugar phosphate isomerase/epimerase